MTIATQYRGRETKLWTRDQHDVEGTLAAIPMERTNGAYGQDFPIYQFPTTFTWLHSRPMQFTDPDMYIVATFH